VFAPTTAGTGSEVTPISIVTTPTTEKKGIVSPKLLPDWAVLDPELTLGLPAPVTAATGIGRDGARNQGVHEPAQEEPDVRSAGAPSADLAIDKLEHQMVMTNGWTRAANAFMSRLGTGTEGSKAFTGKWRELSAIWIEIANSELIATQRSEAYLSSQRNLLKASTDLRLAQQELAAFYGEMFGLPMRAEIDDVHKSLTDLRREIRALKRSISPVQERAHG
jgi:hypothetical protein